MSTPPASAPAQAIEARGLSKSFGDRQALRDVSFSAASGEVLAVIGPNGAGKTTLLSILAGIREPDAGEVHLPRGEVGFVPQQAALYRRLTVEENLRLFARLEEVDDVEATVGQMLEQTALADRRGDQVGTLSGGNQQRINIAIGLLSEPGGAAPRRAVHRPRPAPARPASGSSSSASPASGTTVIFSTHNIAEAERYGRRVLVIADGQGLFDGSVAELNAAAPPTDAEAGSADFESAFVRFLAEHGH